MNAAALKLIATDGEIVTDDCAKCHSLRTRAESAENALDEAEKDLRQKRATINALKKDRDTERRTYAKRAEVVECFEHWMEWKQRVTGRKPTSLLSADRFDNVKARLNEGYSVEQIKLAIDGAMSHPFVVNAKRSPEGKGDRYDDLELIARRGSNLEKLANIGARWRKEQAA